jgi:hypothetical protein
MASKTKWTPTEWTAHKDPTLGSPERWCVYANEAPIGQRMPAECVGPHARWNATLIAAAPDLYTACVMLVHAPSDPDALAAARAALVKAVQP